MHNPEVLILEFKKTVQQVYGERLDKIVLYGSYARGDAHVESDIDLLIVLKGVDSTKTETEKVWKYTWGIWESTYVSIHFITMDAEKFYNAKTPLLYWVRKEGKEI